MNNKAFLKSLNILYVEDDEEIRFRIKGILERIFNKVIVANDGQEGIDHFIHAQNCDITIDVIVSDISMPKKTGLEMIREIRAMDKEVPFIFTTAYSNSEYLLDAINCGVAYYAVKPIDLSELINQIHEVCESQSRLRMIGHKNDELLEYMQLIDQVALVSKIDLDGNYVFVNEIFCQTSGYNKEELLGKNKDIVMHNDIPKVLCEELWNTIKSGHKWSGKLKNRTKDDNDYFTKTTVVPNYDINRGGIVEYVEISFLITVDEQEKREFRKKVMQNIQETKRQNYVARNMINELQDKLKRFQHIDILEETLINEREKTKKLKRQSKYYEIQLEIVNRDKEYIKHTTNKNVQRMSEELTRVKYKKDVYYGKANDLKDELTERMEFCENLNRRIKEQSKIIRNLKDVISYRESQLEKNDIKIA